MKYYNNNLVYAYRIHLIVCTAMVALGGLITLFIVVNNYRSYKKHMQQTYVYSTNGAAVEVNLRSKKEDGKAI